jgi:predicted SAM-dependent methyltransferase
MKSNFDHRIQSGQKVKMLNLGCGFNYHPDWINVDFIATGQEVIAYDLTKGVPFSSEVFDVVYHSNVLEHFNAQQGKFFIAECFRVLKSGGILRIAVPDLEGITRNYLKHLDEALNNIPGARSRYEWMKLELYDQTTRNHPGGGYKQFLQTADDDVKKFAQGRLGKEIMAIQQVDNSTFKERLMRRSFTSYLKYIRLKISQLFLYIVGGKRMSRAFETGLFRYSGEIHQCMYDRFSLAKLLEEVGFQSIRVRTAFDSDIAGFSNFRLDGVDGTPRKPDSLFMEARKG